jgi:hypothetical protein
MSFTRSSMISALTLAIVLAVGSNAHAASEGFLGGGFLQQGFDALRDQLVQPQYNAGPMVLEVVDQSKAPVVGFTPRFAGVPIDLGEGASLETGSLLRARLGGAATTRSGRAISLVQSHDLGPVKLDLSAIAGFTEQDDPYLDQSKAFSLGSSLKFSGVEGLRLDAAYSRRDEILGFANDRVTASLGYGFGQIDTRLSVSSVSQYDNKGIETEEQQVWSVGGQLQLGTNLSVGGDLAYSDSLVGADATTGVVNFRFNF